MKITPKEGHIGFNVTPVMIERLMVLASFLEHEVLPPDDKGSHFNMRSYLRVRKEDFHYNQDYAETKDMVVKGEVDPCGTTACAAGWAAVIHKRLRMRVPTKNESLVAGSEYMVIDWEKFSGKLTGHNMTLFKWLFDGSWTSWDNTPNGAARRIRYALKYGIPDDFDTFPRPYDGMPDLDTPQPETLPEVRKR